MLLVSPGKSSIVLMVYTCYAYSYLGELAHNSNKDHQKDTMLLSGLVITEAD